MRTRVLSVAALAIVVAPLVASPTAAGPASDQLVRHGQGIGKLRLGMTIAEVKRILGAPRAQNKREKRPRGYVYIEQDWDYGWWTVGFLRAPRGEYRAVSIGTVQRSQRTPEGLGVGSRKEELARRLEELRCWEVQSLPMTFGGFTNECVYVPGETRRSSSTSPAGSLTRTRESSRSRSGRPACTAVDASGSAHSRPPASPGQVLVKRERASARASRTPPDPGAGRGRSARRGSNEPSRTVCVTRSWASRKVTSS
jgi:hypothetical protein